MTAIWTRINTLLLLLVLFTLVGLAGMFAAGVLGGPLDPPGPPSATDSVRLPGTPITGPTIITQPGHYYLTRNITVPVAPSEEDDTSGIVINVDNVTLDLGGFTIFGDATSNQRGIQVNSPSGVVISNGAIRDVRVGVNANVLGAHISGITVRGGEVGIVLGEDAVLEDCTVTGVSRDGVNIAGSRATVRRCVIASSGRRGVTVALDAHGVLIEDSVIKANNTSVIGGAGIALFANQATIRAIRIS